MILINRWVHFISIVYVVLLNFYQKKKNKTIPYWASFVSVFYFIFFVSHEAKVT